MNLPQPPLLLGTDRSQARGDLVSIVTAAFAGGCRWVSLREKDLSQAEQIDLLQRLLAEATPYEAIVTLHGDPTVAVAAGAHGAHIEAGGNARAARKMLGHDGLLGLSVHSAEEARGADPQMVDYLVAGPAFLTESKPGYGPQLVPDALRLLCATTSIPVIAIGGIFPHNAADCIAAGAAGIAVMGGVMKAEDPRAEIAGLVDALAAAGQT
jgi:thiamine-phosphate pyrophosphorylase